MSDKKVEVNSQKSAEGVVRFPEAKTVELCSYNECAGGHKWKVAVLSAECRGCGGAVFAVKMENCPVCNEPVEKCKLRLDHISSGMQISKVCLGEPSPGEVGHVELTREHAKNVEERATEEKRVKHEN